jgi:long-chain acyl-CoA synthetase
VNLAHLIDDHPADRVALVRADDGRQVSYGELREQVAAARAGLTRLGVGPGGRVALAVGNELEFVVAYLAVLGRGAAVVPMEPSSPTAVIEHEIAAVGATVAIVGPVARAAFAAVDRDRVPTVAHVVATPLPPGDHGEPDDDRSWSALLALPPGTTAAPIVDVGEDALAALVFTSGTAGAPKAAMLSHGNLLANLRQSQSGPDPLVATDVVYGVLPLEHVYGLNVVLGLSLLVGATLVLEAVPRTRFQPSAAIAAIARHGVTVLPGVPPMWSAFADLDAAALDGLAGGGDPFGGVRIALSGASKMPEQATCDLRDRFGLQLAEGYGLTEASPVVTSSVGIPMKVGSVGRVLDGIDVRLVDDAGDDVLAGDVGEIWVRGPNVFLGYLDDAEATAKAIGDGWLHTGDVAVADDDGYLFLVDRSKDLIIVSGFNVYPAEVEDVIAANPAVADVAVVGRPDPHTGEAVHAYVVLRPGVGAVDRTSLREWCGERLARYKCPTEVVIVDQLPRGLAGKLLRRQLG